MHSDWLKLVMRLATSNQSAFFVQEQSSYSILKLMYDIDSCQSNRASLVAAIWPILTPVLVEVARSSVRAKKSVACKKELM